MGYIRDTVKTVRILNLTKNTLIAQEAQVASSLRERLKGLLGRSGLGANEALILKPCSSIHTFFMRFPIDVLFLDRNMRIIRLIQPISPNRLSPTVWRAKMVIELPAGRIAQTQTQAGDMVEIKNQGEHS